MARKVTTFTVESEGRDKGKTFQITEMPADQAERWAIRALLALAGTGVELPDGVSSAGMAGIAGIGLTALTKLPFAIAEPLLDEMFDCVLYVSDAGIKTKVSKGVNSQIEEVRTRFELRAAVFKLHVDFSIPGADPTTA